MELTQSRGKPLSIFFFLGLIFIVLLFYLPILKNLVSDWYNDSNYSHGFLVPLVSVYLIYKKREFLRNIPWVASKSGLLILVLGLLIFVVATAGAEYFSANLSLVIILLGLTWYFFGTKILKNIWFSFFFLLFMIPLPYTIYYSATFPMQLFSSKAVTILFNLLGLSALRQGNVIHLPNYSLEVVEACSGLRSLVSLLALGALWAYLTQKSRLKQVILFISTVPIAIAANIFRIFVTGFGAYVISPKLAEKFLHEVSGILVFLFSLVVLIIWGAILKWIGKKSS
jgi:exosortase